MITRHGVEVLTHGCCPIPDGKHFFGEASGAEALGFKRDDRPAGYWVVPTRKYPIPLPASTRLYHPKQRAKSMGN